MEYNLQRIHGSNVTKEGLALFDRGLTQGDHILLPARYHLYYKEQPRADFFRELNQIQCYTSTIDYSND